MNAFGGGYLAIVNRLLSSFRCKSILSNIFTFRLLFLIVTLCALPIAAISSEIDPYIGIYKADSDYQTYVIIKNHNNRYFGHASSGTVELVIDDKGKLKSTNTSIDITGHFEDKKEGKYSKTIVNVFGVQSVYNRIDIPQEQYISALYDSEKQMTNFSSVKNDACANAYSSVPLSNVTDKSKYIDALISKIDIGRNNFNNINSLLILKDNKLVVEHYFNGWNVDEPHTVQSVSKSLTSLLVGAAVTENKIVDIKQTLPEFLPNYKEYLSGEKEEITLQNLLTMSAGLDWDEWSISYANPENIRYEEIASADSVAFTLARPLVNKPGTTFSYSGGFVSVVGEVIRQATNQPSVSDYAKNGPLSELCFENAYWFKQGDNRTNVAGGAYLRPRDMLKLGQLVLNEGSWNGKQLIDKEWIIESTKPALDTNLAGTKYGYFWWQTKYYLNGKKYSAILAQGYGGQDIVIIKDLNLVVVKTASNYNSMSLIGRMMTINILPAFEKSKTL